MTTDQILATLEARDMWAEGPRPVEQLKKDWAEFSASLKMGDDPARYARWLVHRRSEEGGIEWIEIVSFGDTLREAATEAVGKPMF